MGPIFPDVSEKCPLCGGCRNRPWAIERSIRVVRCLDCALLFVSPVPNADVLEKAVRTGVQAVGSELLNVKSRRSTKKIAYYKSVFSEFFPYLATAADEVLWLDVGCGYGEAMQAVSSLSSVNVRVVGVEPMSHKASIAKGFGLNVENSFLAERQFQADIISLIDIFSHVPNFRSLLATIASNLKPGGDLFIETGNLADLSSRDEFPNELGLPDHLVFAGETQIIQFLTEAGFRVQAIRRVRIDNFFYFFKGIVKLMLGRPVKISIPYSSPYRQIQIRAKLI